MAYKGGISKIVAQTGALQEYLLSHPDIEEEVVLQNLKFTRNTLYRFLMGMTEDPRFCSNGEFLVMRGEKRLTVEGVSLWLQDSKTKRRRNPKQPERLLYLYHILHSAIPYGGLTIRQLEQQYEYLIEESGGMVTSQQALKRMLYRDINELEGIGVAVARPTTGSKKYRLDISYLPKLAPESAQAVYVSMLLFQDTVLHGATACAQRELEKVFIKNKVSEPNRIKERLHIIGDTLLNPVQFGDRFGKLVHAVAESYRVNIVYAKLDGDVSQRILEPLGLVCKRHVWYLIARLASNGEYRTFRMDQIEKAWPRWDEKFEYPQDFSVARHVGDSWGVFTNDKVQVVRVQFNAEVAPRVKNLRYHASQEICQELKDGSLVVQYKVCGLIELKSWLLQWGSNVKVLKPRSLQKQVAKEALEVWQLYQNDEVLSL